MNRNDEDEATHGAVGVRVRPLMLGAQRRKTLLARRRNNGS
jgi:hypothetical protein